MSALPTAHVIFPLDVEDGWPPINSERLWAYDLGDERYKIDNVPWFVRDLAIDDVVHAVAPNAESHPVFKSMLERSGHLTIRIACLPQGPLGGECSPVVDEFVGLGAYAEGFAKYRMVALDLAPGIELRPIYDHLEDGAARGSWAWEEGRINSAWDEVTQPTF